MAEEGKIAEVYFNDGRFSGAMYAVGLAKNYLEKGHYGAAEAVLDRIIELYIEELNNDD